MGVIGQAMRAVMESGVVRVQVDVRVGARCAPFSSFAVRSIGWSLFRLAYAVLCIRSIFVNPEVKREELDLFPTISPSEYVYSHMSEERRGRQGVLLNTLTSSIHIERTRYNISAIRCRGWKPY